MVPVTVWRPAMVAVQVLGSVGAHEPSGAMVKPVELVRSPSELP
jgi:hypothetical protein